MSNKIIKFFLPASRIHAYPHDNITYSGTNVTFLAAALASNYEFRGIVRQGVEI